LEVGLGKNYLDARPGKSAAASFGTDSESIQISCGYLQKQVFCVKKNHFSV
jgi:hypothetical protein